MLDNGIVKEIHLSKISRRKGKVSKRWKKLQYRPLSDPLLVLSVDQVTREYS